MSRLPAVEFVASWKEAGALEWRCLHCKVRILGYMLGSIFLSSYKGRTSGVEVAQDGKVVQVCDQCGRENVWLAGKGVLDVGDRIDGELARLSG